MLTYELKKVPGVPLYELLYRCLRQDIQSGVLAPGTKLPSKRALAQHLEVSKITVETAYGQLLAEGYISSREKVGYFVEAGNRMQQVRFSAPVADETPQPELLDLTTNGSAHFPFSVWTKLQREVILDLGTDLLQPIHRQGCPELRQAIAAHLTQFRGMHVNPDNVVIGAGTDFLYNLLIQLLGRDKLYAVEEPGYGKIRQIYAAGGVQVISAPMDDLGVCPELLDGAQVLHISPSHHFPTGIVTPVGRRQELLDWANRVDGYIIEDDYDSEFRFHAHPMPMLCSLDHQGRVIYMNTFSKSLTPAIRISYMILPAQLMAQYHQKLGFYSGTVPSFEQYTLARLLSRGYFEKHINRMRKFYKARRDKVILALQNCPWQDRITIWEKNAGLHFLVQVDTSLEDGALIALWERCGIRVRTLGSYYHGAAPQSAHRTLVINYSGLDEAQLERLNALPLLQA